MAELYFVSIDPLKLPPVTDQELFDGIARRDNATFQYLYRKYRVQILQMVSKHNGNDEDALDVFQEGLIALWTNIHQGKFELRPGVKLSTYLFALCRNRWISKLRRRKMTHSLDDEAGGFDVPDDTGRLDEHYERIRELERQLAKLNETCRRLLGLFYYQKAALKEIAQQLDITEKTAKNNKYRCMQQLRSQYGA